jgi:hypothetical protein
LGLCGEEKNTLPLPVKNSDLITVLIEINFFFFFFPTFLALKPGLVHDLLC